jgi:protein SCO1/2
MLKLYLLDAAGNVREIYTPAFLHQAVLLNDIRTLLMERQAGTGRR